MPKKAEEKEAKESKEEESKVETPKKISQQEFEKKVKELAKKGLTSEKIGEQLRQQGIHPKEYDKKISKILGDGFVNSDFKNIEAKLERIKKHFENNKQDKRAMREKDRVFAQLRKIKKYLKQI